jgi:hypothetical protein
MAATAAAAATTAAMASTPTTIEPSPLTITADEVTDPDGSIGILLKVTQSDKIYQLVVKDFQACQGTEALLTTLGCRKFILKNVKKFECIYDRNLDIMVVYTSLYDIVMKFELPRNIVEPESPLEQRIKLLEERIKLLEEQIKLLEEPSEPYETICDHIYPDWAAYEEFAKLPGFKYFKASWNFNKSTKIERFDGNDFRVVGEHKSFDNMKIVIEDNPLRLFEVDLAKLAGVKRCEDGDDCDGTTNCDRFFMKGNVDDDYYCAIITNKKTIRFGHIDSTWLRYCIEFIHGFMILEWKDLICDSIHVELIVTYAEESRIIIKRSKNPIVISANNETPIYLPKPKITLNLYGVRVQIE